jgi:hypothetical protein
MKSSWILFSCLFLSVGLLAQSTEEIIRQHIEAIGGEENWHRIESIVISGTAKSGIREMKWTKSAVRDSAICSDLRIVFDQVIRNEMMYYLIVNGQEGWRYVPEDRNNTISPLYPAEIEEARDELDYEDPFIRYLEKGREINMIGLEYYDEKEYYKFLIQYKSGKKFNCYMNSTTLMIDLMEETGTKSENLRRFLRYEKIPEGIWMAKTIISTSGELNIDSVVINQPIPASAFKPSKKNRYTLQR